MTRGAQKSLEFEETVRDGCVESEERIHSHEGRMAIFQWGKLSAVTTQTIAGACKPVRLK